MRRVVGHHLFLVGATRVHHADETAGDGEGAHLGAGHPLVRLRVVLQDLVQAAHALEARQHVDDRAHRRALHRHAAPRHVRRRLPLIGADLVVFYRVQAAYDAVMTRLFTSQSTFIQLKLYMIMDLFISSQILSVIQLMDTMMI